MTIEQAQEIIRGIDYPHATDEALEALKTAYQVMYAETDDLGFLFNLGGVYYDQREFDKAIPYFLRAAEADLDPALESLGFAYLYGNGVEVDDEKAFDYFSRSAEKGNRESRYKIADMFRDGRYVNADYNKYVLIIEQLWEEDHNPDGKVFSDPFPEIAIRLAEIRYEQNRKEESLTLYRQARDFMEFRMTQDLFWGNFEIMKRCVIGMDTLFDVDLSNFNFWDLYAMLRTPIDITMTIGDVDHHIISSEVDGHMVVLADGEQYDNIDTFMQWGKIDGQRICESLIRTPQNPEPGQG